MLDERQFQPTATQQALKCCPDGARWAHEMTGQVYFAGGNEEDLSANPIRGPQPFDDEDLPGNPT